MSKITIEKVVPAKTLTKRRVTITKSKKILFTLFLIFIIPILILANSFITKKLFDKSKRDTTTTTPIGQKTQEVNPPNTDIPDIIDAAPPIPLPKNVEIANEFGDAVIEYTRDYKIIYYGKDKHFTIAVYSLPFETYRPIAEEAFLTNLKISKETACQLNVEVIAPKSPDNIKTGLSFCEQD